MKKVSNPIDEILGRYKPARREDLIPILQEIQEKEGFISEQAIIRVGNHMKLSTTKIYGLATFYDQFRFKPKGLLHLVVCNGTACYLNGAGAILKKIREELGIEPGETTRDGRFSYDVVTCMGGCSNGPLILVACEFLTGVKPEDITSILGSLKKNTTSENI